MLYKPYLTLILITVIFMLSGCSKQPSHIDAEQLLDQINSAQAPVIVDVRTQAEFDAGHIPGAIHIPFWQAFSTDKLDQIDKSKPLILYCQHGPRAGIAKFALNTSGFEQLLYLQGHMAGWRQADHPVTK